jgi:hypothetical protein
MQRKRTTANEPIGEIDPGGTHGNKGKHHKANAKTKRASKQNVQTGDRNAMKGKTPS